MNRLTTLVICMLAATASSQEWAKARLEKSPRHLEWVKVKQGNREVQIDMGNETLTIKMGNQTTKLNLGASSTEAMQSAAPPAKIARWPTDVAVTPVKLCARTCVPRSPPAVNPVPMPMPRPATEICPSTNRSPPSMKRTIRSLIAPSDTRPATPIAMPRTVNR